MRERAAVLRELRGIRQVLDVHLWPTRASFKLRLPEGSATDIIQEAVVKPAECQARARIALRWPGRAVPMST